MTEGLFRTLSGVVVIEQSLDVIKTADHVLDLGSGRRRARG